MEEFKIDDEYLLRFNTETKHWDTYQNNELLPKSTEKLFKYFPLNLYSIDMLLRNYFFLSNPSNFNDPFDCSINLTNEVDVNELKTVKRNVIKNIGVCCFSETIDNQLMWAHYTNNYNGFALEFNGNSIETKIPCKGFKRYSLTRVNYPLLPPKIDKGLPFAYHYLLTTKYKHWSYEKEWRFIAELSSENREIEYFPESVKAIYIGHKIPDENLSAYKMLLEIQEIRFPEVPIFVVYPHSTELKLNFEKVWPE